MLIQQRWTDNLDFFIFHPIEDTIMPALEQVHKAASTWQRISPMTKFEFTIDGSDIREALKSQCSDNGSVPADTGIVLHDIDWSAYPDLHSPAELAQTTQDTWTAPVRAQKCIPAIAANLPRKIPTGPARHTYDMSTIPAHILQHIDLPFDDIVLDATEIVSTLDKDKGTVQTAALRTKGKDLLIKSSTPLVFDDYFHRHLQTNFVDCRCLLHEQVPISIITPELLRTYRVTTCPTHANSSIVSTLTGL